MKKISVIIPVYNIGAFLDQCIRSVISQTYTELEIILVDDGSGDDSGAICDHYAQKDSRIKVLHKENGGLVSARKAGLQISSGDYIGFVDGDDYIEANMYENLIKVCSQGAFDFVHSGYQMTEKSSTTTKKEFCLNSIEERLSVLKNSVLIKDTNHAFITPSIWSKLFRAPFIKEQYNKVPDESSYGEDLVCLCHCVLNCSSFAVMDEAYYHYRERDDSISHNLGKRIVNDIGLFKRLLDIFVSENIYQQAEEELNTFFVTHMQSTLRDISVDDPFAINRYGFPCIEDLFGKKIVLYGAGVVGCDYYSQMCRFRNIEIVKWIDKNATKYKYDCCEVEPVDALSDCEFDKVVIAVLNQCVAKDIRDSLLDHGVSEEDVIWREPQALLGS